MGSLQRTSCLQGIIRDLIVTINLEILLRDRPMDLRLQDKQMGLKLQETFLFSKTNSTSL